jgi:hypothetical protein
MASNLRAIVRMVVWTAPLVVCVAAVSSVLGDTQPALSQDRFNAKALETVSAYAASLSQYAYLIIGATLLLIFGGKHRPPADVRLRGIYLLFIPVWALLIFSIYFGARVQQAHLAYLLFNTDNFTDASRAMNGDSSWQMKCLIWGIVLLGTWTTAYLFYWIFGPQPAQTAELTDEAGNE